MKKGATHLFTNVKKKLNSVCHKISKQQQQWQQIWQKHTDLKSSTRHCMKR
jgi:hypothetical protein